MLSLKGPAIGNSIPPLSRLMSLPICHRCPHCGVSEYQAERPQGWIAFQSDRQCAACGTIYSPPTPIWAAAVLISLGFVLMAGGVLSLGVAIQRQWLIGLPLNLAASLIGFLCVRRGMGALREIVVEAPAVPATGSDVAARSPVKSWREYGPVIASLLGALAFVLVLYGIGHQAHQHEVARKTRQNEAIQAAKRVGGVLGWRDSTVTGIDLKRADAWTQSFEGQQFGNRDIADDDLEVLDLFPELEDITIISPEVTDAGLSRLPERLTRLVIQCPRVTEQGLAGIAKMRRLESLDLESCQLRTLAGLALDQKPLLENLNLAGTQLTSEGAAPLAFAKKVTTLNLNATAIDDECMPIIGQLSVLEELRLDGTLITDEGLLHLGSLRRLRWLYAADTGVTSEGKAQLKQRLPYCDVYIKSYNVPPGTLIFPEE